VIEKRTLADDTYSADIYLNLDNWSRRLQTLIGG
jgi:hypothetical protein